MDIQLYLRVIWRFRALVACGMLLAIALALLSYVRVDFAGGLSFTYRQSEQWESLSTVGVGSRSFTPGSAVPPEIRNLLQAPPQTEEERRQRLAEADASRYSSLAALNESTVQLMQLATSDQVMQIMREDGGGPIRGALQTFPVTSGDSLVPYITFSAIAATPEEALTLARRHVEAFTEFVTTRQEASGLAEDERIVLYLTRQPQPAVLLEARKKTRPILIFLAVMTATLGLAFVLENLRPRVRMVAPTDDEGAAGLRHRRSA